MRLIDERTADGSRCFARLSSDAVWRGVCEHLLRLPGVESAPSPGGEFTSSKLDFHFRGYRFQMALRDGELFLIVRDPLCSDLLLCQIAYHLSELQEREREKDAT